MPLMMDFGDLDPFRGSPLERETPPLRTSTAPFSPASPPGESGAVPSGNLSHPETSATRANRPPGDREPERRRLKHSKFLKVKDSPVYGISFQKPGRAARASSGLIVFRSSDASDVLIISTACEMRPLAA